MKKAMLFFVSLVLSSFGWTQDGIDLTYVFERDQEDASVIRVSATITNHTSEDIYFLSESCNGLDYYLSTSSSLAEISVLVHCNATYPRKIELKAGSNYEFKTRIQLKGDLEKLGLNVTLVRLLKSSNVESKFIHEIRKENAGRIMNLEGKELRI